MRKNQRRASRWRWNQRKSVRQLKELGIQHKPQRIKEDEEE